MVSAAGYRSLASALREAIVEGRYPPGSTLPRQQELAEQHGVNVKTVRTAIAMLAGEGLVTPIRRRGTVVREQPPMRRLGADRYAKSKWKTSDVVAFIADRESSGQPWSRTDQTQTVARVEADAETAEALSLPLGSIVVERARVVREPGGIPTHMLTSYYRAEDVEGTPITNPEPGPAGAGGGFAVLTLQGLEPHTISEAFHARMPTPDEVELLQLPAGEPVMVLQRQTSTKDGRVVEFARGVHAATRFSWRYTFDVPE